MTSSFCASCGAELAPNARFCTVCGTPANAACASCGNDVPAGAAFCPACGAAQATGEAVELAANEELRVITAMFIDLAGFTSHTERSDPEDVRERLSVFHRKVREDVTRFGGSVEKLMGDGVFAVWGVPTAYEDDPERAVRTGLRIQQSIAEANIADESLNLSLRIGIATGQAIVQMDESTEDERIIGDVVNTASRLEGVAEQGTVVIDERTYLAVRTSVDCTPLEPVQVKGKAESVAIWRADEAKSRFGVAVDQEEATAFVGRAEELSLLTEAFERTVARRSPQLVTVVGEPGVGKSRLVRELFDVIDDRPDLTRWRQGRNLPYGEGITFWALSEIVKSEAGILESESPDRARSKLIDAVSALSEGMDGVDDAWLIDRLGPLAGIAGESSAEQSELFSAWLQFFELMARSTPLVMVIEDLHWADESLADFLEHLIDWADDAPILVLATTRPEWFERRPAWGGGKREGVTINLAALSGEETGTLVAALADASVIPSSVQDVLMERSGGNPLYVTEYVRLATEQGWFAEGVEVDDVPLPDSVQSIIASRIDLLDPEGRSTIHAASVVGRVFWTGALTYVRGADDGAIRDRLNQLAQRELVQPVRRSSMEGQDEFTFAHVLARDVAYGQLTRSERARLHRETARWLEAVSAGREIDVAELLAYHHTTALDLEPTSDPDVLARVYRFLMLAGQRTSSLDADRSAGFYERAAQHAPTTTDKARAFLLWGDAPVDGYQDGIERLEQAIELFRTSGDRLGEAEAMATAASVHWWAGNKPQADALGNAAVDLIEDAEPSEAVARVLAKKALNDQLAGREAESLDVAERALVVARAIGDTKNYATILRAKGSALLASGDPSGLELIEEALRIHLDRGDTMEAMSSFNNVATFEGYKGEVRQAVQTIDRGVEYGRSRGAGPFVEWSLMTKNESLYQMGEFAEYERSTRELLVADEARGGTQTGHFAALNMLVVRLIAGQHDGLWEEVRERHRRSEEIADPQVIIPSLALVIRIATDLGVTDQVGPYLDTFTELATEHSMHGIVELPSVAIAYLRAGRAEELARLVAVLRQGAEAFGGWMVRRIEWAEAMLMASDGDLDRAFESMLPIIAEGDERGVRYTTTRFRIDAIHLALATGDHTRAVELIEQAAVDSEAMGTAILSRQIEELRAELPAD